MKWQKTVDIKVILQPYKDIDYISDEQTQTCGESLATLLKQHLPEYLDGPEFGFVENQEHLNDLLDDLYDWADAKRIWLGLYST